MTLAIDNGNGTTSLVTEVTGTTQYVQLQKSLAAGNYVLIVATGTVDSDYSIGFSTGAGIAGERVTGSLSAIAGGCKGPSAGSFFSNPLSRLILGVTAVEVFSFEAAGAASRAGARGFGCTSICAGIFTGGFSASVALMSLRAITVTGSPFRSCVRTCGTELIGASVFDMA